MSATASSYPWIAYGMPTLPCAPPPFPTEPMSASGFSVGIKVERGALEIDTTVSRRRVSEPYSSASPPSAFTMDSDEGASSETDEELVGPRVEEIDDMKEEAEPETPVTPQDEPPRQSGSTTPADIALGGKRPRGRPRNPSSGKPAQVTKSHMRSKTGCITCRERKKKCDERHPTCMNCEKNNLLCGGYMKKERWQPGRLTRQRHQRTGQTTMRVVVPPMPARPMYVFPGLYLDNELDMAIFEHFESKMSTVLTLRDDGENNPFIEMCIPMAKDHKGLMHSLLALSVSHMIRYDQKPEFEQRKIEHYDSAVTALREEVETINRQNPLALTTGSETPDALIATMIFQLLIPINDGSTNGMHRLHFEAARKIIKPGPDKFSSFAYEFWKYHDMSNFMTSLERPAFPDPTLLPNGGLFPVDGPIAGVVPPGEGVMIGVGDGLYTLISRITAIRDHIRARKRRGLEPAVEYRSIREANLLGKQLLEWTSGHDPNTAKWAAAELYRETALVYLHRSLRASRPDPDLAERVRAGIVYLLALPEDNSAQSNLLLPTFVLGCAAFEHEQRQGILEAFEKIHRFSRLGNIERAREVVHKVWEMMDTGDERSWDWETIKDEMSYDFLVT